MTMAESDSHDHYAISVVIPTYNREDTLGRALQSVLEQTFDEFELLVVDDGSTDRTPELVRDFTDRRLRYLRQARSGRSAARNRGIEQARAPWVTFLDSDDAALPEWLETLVGTAARHPRADVICCGFRGVDTEPDGTFSVRGVRLPGDLGPVHENVKGLFTAGTFAARRTLLRSVGGYATLDFAENTELALRLTETGAYIVSVDRALTDYTLRDPSEAKAPKGIRARFEGARYILEHHGERYRRTSPAGYANYCAIAGVNAVRLGRLSNARAYFLAASRAAPFSWKHHARLLLSLMPPAANRYWLTMDESSESPLIP